MCEEDAKSLFTICLLLLYLHLSSLLMEFKSICVSFIAALSECVKVMMLVGIYP